MLTSLLSLSITAIPSRARLPAKHAVFFFDKKLLFLYSVRQVKLGIASIAPASCWRFCFQACSHSPSALISTLARQAAFCKLLVQIRPCKLLRINTCVGIEKRTTLSAFRMNTYARPPGRRGLIVNRHQTTRGTPKELAAPQRSFALCVYCHYSVRVGAPSRPPKIPCPTRVPSLTL